MKPTKEVVELFEKDRFATENGMVIEDVEDGSAVCGMRLAGRHKNAVGNVMGGVYFTLADFAFAVATNWKKPGIVSLHSDIAFLSTPKGKELHAKALRVREGRSTCYYRIEVSDELGNLAAVINTTGYQTAKR